MIVIQMTEDDFRRVAWVLNDQIPKSIKNARYWNELLKDWERQRDAQLSGFFQCAACVDPHSINKDDVREP